jgi:riboflavin transporter FmnP
MQLTKMKIEKRDIPVIAFSALGGFLFVVIVLASRDIATGVLVGVVLGAPGGAGGGVLACMLRRCLERK